MSAKLRSFTDFILRGRLRAIVVAFLVTFIPLIGTISIVIAGLVTLRKGAVQGLLVAIAATMPYFLLLPFQPLPIGFWVVGIIAASNVLTWGFAALLNRYGNWNLLLELTALIGIMIVTTAHVVKPDLQVWWGAQLNNYLTQTPATTSEVKDPLPNLVQKLHNAKSTLLGQSLEYAKTQPSAPAAAIPAATSHEDQDLSDEGTEPDIISFVNAAKPYATGTLTASLLFTALLQLFVARWWQLSQSNASSQLRLELYHIRLSPMAGLVFLAAIILSYLKIALAQDMLPVLYLTFCMAGLSLAHYACAKFKALGWLWLIVFYSILLCSWLVYHLPLAFQLLALIALLDVWFDWRDRLDRRFP